MSELFSDESFVRNGEFFIRNGGQEIRLSARQLSDAYNFVEFEDIKQMVLAEMECWGVLDPVRLAEEDVRFAFLKDRSDLIDKIRNDDDLCTCLAHIIRSSISARGIDCYDYFEYCNCSPVVDRMLAYVKEKYSD